MNDLTVSQVETLLAEAITEKIEQMESEMLLCDQVEIPVIDRFCDGMYIREITIPKGTLLTGRVHLKDYVDIMLSGDIAVATPEGVKRLTGANVLNGLAGRKRAGYAYEDTRWVTVHKCIVSDGDDYVKNHTVFSLTEYKNRLEAPKCQL